MIFPDHKTWWVGLGLGLVMLAAAGTALAAGHGAAKDAGETDGEVRKQFQAYMPSIEVPALIGKTRHAMHRLRIVLVTTKKRQAQSICFKAPMVSDAMLTVFHANPVKLNRDKTFANAEHLAARIKGFLTKVLGTDTLQEVLIRDSSLAKVRRRKRSVRC